MLRLLLVGSITYTLASGVGNGTVFDVDELEETAKTHASIVAGFLLINCIISVLGNLLVLVTFFTEKPCGTPLRVLLTHLAVANLLVAALGEPMVTISGFTGKWQFGAGGRKFEAFVVTVGGLFSMADLSIISAERLSRLKYAQRTFFNEYRTPAICTVVWLFQIAYCILPFCGIAEWVPEGIGISNSITFKSDDIGDLVYIGCMITTGYFAPLLIISYCYISIYLFIKRTIGSTVTTEEIAFYKTQKTRSTIVGTTSVKKESTMPGGTEATDKASSNAAETADVRAVQPNIPAPVSVDEPSLHRGPMSSMAEQALLSADESDVIERVTRAKRAERQMVTVVGMIIVSFFVSWTPYAIVNILVIFDKSHIQAKTISATIPAVFAKTSTLWSPIIYFFMDNEIKSGCQRTLKKIRRWIRIVYFGGPVRK